MENAAETLKRIVSRQDMSNYTVQKADLEKVRSDIIAIRSSNLKVGPAESYFWKYEESPYGRAECWVAYHKPTGEYVGATSLYPRVVYVNAAPQNIWVSGDYSVNREHRGTGVAIKILLKLAKDIWANEKYTWLYGVPNQKSRPLHYKAGCRKLGNHHKYVKIIRAEYIYRKTKIRNSILAVLLNAGIRLLSRESRFSRPPGISASCIDTFDERFDALWATVKSQYPIIGERTARFLQWRCSEKSGKKYRIFTICRDDELIGYVVFYARSQSLYIDDILCHRDPIVVDTLIAEFSRFGREGGYESIHARYFGSSLFSKALRKYNYHVRGKHTDEILIYAKDNIDTTELINEENWHFLNADLD